MTTDTIKTLDATGVGAWKTLQKGDGSLTIEVWNVTNDDIEREVWSGWVEAPGWVWQRMDRDEIHGPFQTMDDAVADFRTNRESRGVRQGEARTPVPELPVGPSTYGRYVSQYAQDISARMSNDAALDPTPMTRAAADIRRMTDRFAFDPELAVRILEASGVVATLLDGKARPFFDDAIGHVKEVAMKQGGFIDASAFSDDQAVTVTFNAALWFAQASDDEIIQLAKNGGEVIDDTDSHWGGTYEADAIARFSAEDQTASLFEYLATKPRTATGDTIGFECYIDLDEAKSWLQAHRSDLYTRIFTDRTPTPTPGP